MNRAETRDTPNTPASFPEAHVELWVLHVRPWLPPLESE